MLSLPPVGEPFVDATYGTPITRISDALNTNKYASDGKLTWIGTEYPTACPFNCDNTLLILIHESIFALYSGDGQFLRYLPMAINASSEPRWSRTKTPVLYFINGNRLMAHDVSIGETRTVREFAEYQAISGKGESDISADERFVLAGDGHAVFVYDLATNQCSPVFDTEGHTFDSIYIGKSGVTITYNQSGIERFNGIEFYNTGLNFVRQVARAGGHMDITTDTDGEDCLVWCNSNDPKPIASNALVRIRLADGTQTPLATFDWSLALHVSCPDGLGFAYVETYDPQGISPGRLLKLSLSGEGITPIAYHNSHPAKGDTYNWQPRATCSSDGSKLVFSSNWGQQEVGAPGQYSDVYIVKLLETPVVGRRQAPAPHGTRGRRPRR